MIRDDLSTRLIHLTRDSEESTGEEKFLSILDDDKINGNTNLIKGGYRCICFSETPISKIGFILAQPNIHGMRYAPYGIMIDKNVLFNYGARPVIYQPDEDFENLKENQKYRHVRFEPHNNIDFTWEREWRLESDFFEIHPEEVTLIIPSRDIEEMLKQKQQSSNNMYSLLGEIGQLGMKQLPWHFIALEDLGYY